MKIGHLTTEAQRELFEGVVWVMNSLEPDDFQKVLQKFTDVLDDLDQDDFFGTEGWKHLIGED